MAVWSQGFEVEVVELPGDLLIRSHGSLTDCMGLGGGWAECAAVATLLPGLSPKTNSE